MVTETGKPQQAAMDQAQGGGPPEVTLFEPEDTVCWPLLNHHPMSQQHMVVWTAFGD
jgi:hypothetical protein